MRRFTTEFIVEQLGLHGEIRFVWKPHYNLSKVKKLIKQFQEFGLVGFYQIKKRVWTQEIDEIVTKDEIIEIDCGNHEFISDWETASLVSPFGGITDAIGVSENSPIPCLTPSQISIFLLKRCKTCNEPLMCSTAKSVGFKLSARDYAIKFFISEHLQHLKKKFNWDYGINLEG